VKIKLGELRSLITETIETFTKRHYDKALAVATPGSVFPVRKGKYIEIYQKLPSSPRGGYNVRETLSWEECPAVEITGLPIKGPDYEQFGVSSLGPLYVPVKTNFGLQGYLYYADLGHLDIPGIPDISY